MRFSLRVAIVLAAGLSRRFGRGEKLLADFQGKPLLHHAIDRAWESGAGRVLVVTGAARGRTERVVRAARAQPVFARDHRAGMGASLLAGLRAVRPIEREVAIFLGDLPFAGVARGWRLPPGSDALRPVYHGAPGHPLLVRTDVARAKVRARDTGLSGMLDPGRVGTVHGSAGTVLDIDDRAGLRRMRWQTPHR